MVNQAVQRPWYMKMKQPDDVTKSLEAIKNPGESHHKKDKKDKSSKKSKKDKRDKKEKKRDIKRQLKDLK